MLPTYYRGHHVTVTSRLVTLRYGAGSQPARSSLVTARHIGVIMTLLVTNMAIAIIVRRYSRWRIIGDGIDTAYRRLLEHDTIITASMSSV